MANNIKGITIQIDADGTPLERAINDINKESQALSSELRTINNQLKFDPQNTVVLQQKFDVLGEQIQKTRQKLQTLEDAQEKVKEQYANGEIDDGQYRAFQREVEKTKNYLENLEDQQEQTAAAFKQELTTEYEDLQTKIEDTKTHLEELESQQAQMGDAEIGTDAYENLSAEIENTKASLEDLQSQSDAVQGQLSDLDSTAGTLGYNLEGVGTNAQSSADGMGKAEGESSSLADALNKASSMAGMFGGAIGGIMSGGIEGLLDIIPQLVEKVVEFAQAFDEANSILVEKTGASGEALDEFNQIAKDTSMVLDGLDVTGTAGVVGELNTRLDLTGQELQKATALVGLFADVTGTDAEKSVEKLNGVMKNWGVETQDMESLLNKMVVAGQKSGISFDDLANTLSTNQYLFADLGMNLDESIGLLATFEKNSVKSSTAMMGFRTAMSKWAKEGKTSAQGFAELTESIKNARTEQEGNNIAMEYFGTRAGGTLAKAIRDGRFEFDSMTEAIQNSEGALRDTEARADTFSEKAETFGNAVGTVAFSGESLQDVFTRVSDTARLMDTNIGDAIFQYLGLQDAQQGVIDQEEAMAEAHQTEIDLLTEQEQMERLAAGGYETMSTNMDSIQAKIEELNQQYADNYETAYKNIDGSIGLFEDMTIKSGKSVDSMIGSLKSQVAYMDNYASNMKRAAELGIDKGLLEKLSDGSKESAEILQSIVDDGGEHIGELNEEFSKVEEGKKNFSDTYASMVTDFDTKMSQIEKRVELAEDSLNAYDEMYKDGANSVQGFINGANSKLESVKRAFQKLGETAQRETEKTWNMHSPSKVMEKYGEYVTEGFAIGILKELDVVENAMSKLAPPDMKMMGSMAMTKTSRVVTINAPVQVVKELNDAEISRVGGKITDIVGRQFARRTGGVM